VICLRSGPAATDGRQQGRPRTDAQHEQEPALGRQLRMDRLVRRIFRLGTPGTMRPPSTVDPRTSAGFTLLETLIALVVLSVGSLGSVALQLHALQATHSAYQRSLASLIAADAGERLWLGLATGQIDLAWLPEWVQRRDCGGADPHVCLPELEVRIDGVSERRVISVSWAESRFQDAEDGRVRLDYVVELLPERPS